MLCNTWWRDLDVNPSERWKFRWKCPRCEKSDFEEKRSVKSVKIVLIKIKKPLKVQPNIRWSSTSRPFTRICTFYTAAEKKVLLVGWIIILDRHNRGKTNNRRKSTGEKFLPSFAVSSPSHKYVKWYPRRPKNLCEVNCTRSLCCDFLRATNPRHTKIKICFLHKNAWYDDERWTNT